MGRSGRLMAFYDRSKPRTINAGLAEFSIRKFLRYLRALRCTCSSSRRCCSWRLRDSTPSRAAARLRASADRAGFRAAGSHRLLGVGRERGLAWRMVTPPKGDVASIPLNAAGRKVADAWDLARDNASGNQCKAFGAAAVMRIPGRLHDHLAGRQYAQDRNRRGHADPALPFRRNRNKAGRAESSGILGRHVGNGRRRRRRRWRLRNVRRGRRGRDEGRDYPVEPRATCGRTAFHTARTRS